MSKLFFTADWHLSHKAVVRFRPQFNSVEDHDEFVLDRCKTIVSKRDVMIFVGDIAFSKESLAKVNEIECLRKILVLGNHCTDYNHITSLTSVFDHIHGLWHKRNYWVSHCPIHPSDMREKQGCIHSHKHSEIIDDPRYISVCLEQHDYKPVTFKQLIDNHNEKWNGGLSWEI